MELVSPTLTFLITLLDCLAFSKDQKYFDDISPSLTNFTLALIAYPFAFSL